MKVLDENGVVLKDSGCRSFTSDLIKYYVNKDCFYAFLVTVGLNKEGIFQGSVNYIGLYGLHHDTKKRKKKCILKAEYADYFNYEVLIQSPKDNVSTYITISTDSYLVLTKFILWFYFRTTKYFIVEPQNLLMEIDNFYPQFTFIQHNF